MFMTLAVDPSSYLPNSFVRVLLGNWTSAISRREADKEDRYVEESDDGKPSRRAEEALTLTILLSRERTKILRVG